MYACCVLCCLIIGDAGESKIREAEKRNVSTIDEDGLLDLIRTRPQNGGNDDIDQFEQQETKSKSKKQSNKKRKNQDDNIDDDEIDV